MKRKEEKTGTNNTAFFFFGPTAILRPRMAAPASSGGETVRLFNPAYRVDGGSGSTRAVLPGRILYAIDGKAINGYGAAGSRNRFATIPMVLRTR